MEHTPWEFRETGVIETSGPGNVRFIAEVYPHGFGGELTQEDKDIGAHIVAACNHHEELVETLGKLYGVVWTLLEHEEIKIPFDLLKTSEERGGDAKAILQRIEKGQ